MEVERIELSSGSPER